MIKCLFATETFSIGINMPAKTVVFTKTKKFDGKVTFISEYERIRIVSQLLILVHHDFLLSPLNFLSFMSFFIPYH